MLTSLYLRALLSHWVYRIRAGQSSVPRAELAVEGKILSAIRIIVNHSAKKQTNLGRNR